MNQLFGLQHRGDCPRVHFFVPLLGGLKDF